MINKKHIFIVAILIVVLFIVINLFFSFASQTNNKIYVLWRHQDVMDIWQSQGAKNLNILHLDFHDDLREALINREAQIIYQLIQESEIDSGNFLTYAVFDGTVEQIRWVHGIPGGREYDTGTVIYKSDLSEQEFQDSISNKKRTTLKYEVILYENWSGLEKKQYLNIDWDFFAGKQMPKEDIKRKMEQFLKKDIQYIPEQTYIAYSPVFSHHSLELYEEFVNRLAKKFNAKIDNSYFKGLIDYKFNWQT